MSMLRRDASLALALACCLAAASCGSSDSGAGAQGQNDFVSVPVASSDGRSCAIQEIILRAQGVQ